MAWQVAQKGANVAPFLFAQNPTNPHTYTPVDASAILDCSTLANLCNCERSQKLRVAINTWQAGAGRAVARAGLH